MPTIADLKKQYPDLDGLDDNQVVDVMHQAYYADLPREQIAASLGVKPPPEAVKPRTWGEAAKDTGAALMQGGAGLVKSAGDLYGLAAGDMANPVSQAANSAQEYWQDAKSPTLKRKMAERDADIKAQDGIGSKAWTAFKDTVTDPALAVDTVAGNAATMIPGAAAGRAVAGVVAGRAMAFGPLTEAAGAAAAKSAGNYGTAAAIAAGGVQQGADVSSNVFDDAMKKPEAVWDTNPDFVAKVEALGGNTPENRQTVKTELATTAARMTFPAAAAISFAANGIPGATMLERALVGGAAKQTIKDGMKYALPKAIAKGAAGEMAQEAIEEGGGQFAGNVASKAYVDPNQDLSHNVGENAGMGAAGGFLMGGAGGAMHNQTPHVEDKGPLSRAANAGIDAAGPPPAPPPTLQPVAPAVATALLAHANTRAQELADKEKGRKAIDTTPEVAKQFLTPAEKDEQTFLNEHGGDAQALAHAYPGLAQDTPSKEAGTTPQAAPVADMANPIPANVNPETGEVASPIAQREKDRPAEPAGQVQDGDILNGQGKPFTTMPGAITAQKKAGDTHEIVRVAKGLVVRKKASDGTTDAIQPAVVEPAATGRADAPASVAPGSVAGDPAQAGQGGIAAADLGQPGEHPAGTDAGTVALPPHLAGAKPRYAYGSKQFTLAFDNDIDKAAYITAQKTPSKMDDHYLKFLREATGMTPAQARTHGQAVREAIKSQAKDAPAGELKVPVVSRKAPESGSAATLETQNTNVQPAVESGSVASQEPETASTTKAADATAPASAPTVATQPTGSAATEVQAPKPVAADRNGHFAAGEHAFKAGEPRVLPSYYTVKVGKNPKDWYRGWDKANADAPVSETSPQVADRPAAEATPPDEPSAEEKKALITAQVELRKRIAVMKSLMECMA